jgi:pyrroline-5-carboxylate reductase
MINISIYGAGHLTKSLLTGLGRVSDTKISIFNRTESKIYDLNSIYCNLEKKDSLYELIKERTILFCIVPVDAIINLDLNVIEKLKQTNSILVSCANGLSLEMLNDKFSGLKIIRLLPNVNWQICEGVSLFDCNDKVTEGELNDFYEFLSPVTKLYRVTNDMVFEKIGTLTTCSPGLFCTIIDYFNEYFNVESLNEKEIFYESLRGTIDYILHSRKDPKTISCEVANKGGLTEVGIKAIQQQFPLCIELVSTSMKNKVEERKEKFRLRRI